MTVNKSKEEKKKMSFKNWIGLIMIIMFFIGVLTYIGMTSGIATVIFVILVTVGIYGFVGVALYLMLS